MNNAASIFYILVLLTVLVVTVVVSAISGRWIALEKGRSRTEGLILGLFLGPLGVLIEALLPEWNPPESDDLEIKPAWKSEFERNA